jgi:hypothetical protein
LESSPCAALCVKADVSALGKFGVGSLPCAALCVKADVSALGKFGFQAFCLKLKLRAELVCPDLL